MTLLQVSGLTIEDRQGIALVDKLSLTLNAGDILGLVGESGSGKTLSCRAMMRLLPGEGLQISGGEIRFYGTDLLTLNDKRMTAIRGREIGMIFQNPASHLNPVMTIGQQITESRRLHFSCLQNRGPYQLVTYLTRVFLILTIFAIRFASAHCT